MIVLESMCQSKTLRSSLCPLYAKLAECIQASISHSPYLALPGPLRFEGLKEYLYIFLYTLPSYFVLLLFFFSF